jgi:hypothetical protein
MALNKALFTETNPEERWKKFRLSVAITAGLFIVLVMLYFGLDYEKWYRKDHPGSAQLGSEK